MVHKGEYVMSKRTTDRIGVGNLEALHRGALADFDGGGYVGSAPGVRRAHMTANQNTPVAQPIQINAPITVNGSAGTRSRTPTSLSRCRSSLSGPCAASWQTRCVGRAGPEIF
ncbi:hypothetical protein [Mesorhizobium sp. B1-1-5]|uniref:hypothetical protein n=1 Tax=Mesorhizobium sp. B1-1-5 TaxID=2589979 RepID=UPI001129EA82|nr:hypothetical protein [Mesorhizobium sp. B1-1-5]TPO01008.1 hypothetical protein FJ980_22500 [Mesorhizobium sp. B1-1-5]